MSQILDLAQKLITIPSIKENPAARRDVLEAVRRQLPEFKVTAFEKDGTASLLFSNQNTRNFKIILNAHLDVVPAQDSQFQPRVSDGRLYGRGASDMKGAAAAEIRVFKDLAGKVSYSLGLQLVTDEEIGGFAGTKHQIEQGVRAGFVIAGEPTDFGLNHQAKGITWLKIKATGRSAHGAYPWDGQNAIWQAHQFLTRLKKAFPVPARETWKTTVNLAKIETSNTTFNKVPEDCLVSLDVRYIPGDSDTVIEKIRSLLSPGLELEVVVKEPSQTTDAANQYMQSLRRAVKKVTGKLPPLIKKHGGSDIRHFNAAGCPGVCFGPIGAGLHTDAEWVDTQSLEDYYQILKQFLLNL